MTSPSWAKIGATSDSGRYLCPQQGVEWDEHSTSFPNQTIPQLKTKRGQIPLAPKEGKSFLPFPRGRKYQLQAVPAGIAGKALPRGKKAQQLPEACEEGSALTGGD